MSKGTWLDDKLKKPFKKASQHSTVIDRLEVVCLTEGSIRQTLNLDGFIIVSTPQELAALDAKRSINMIKKLNLKVFGVVENMSGGIFGKGGASMMADELNLPVLSEISLLPEYSDNNDPAVLNNSQCEEEFSKLMSNLEEITSNL